MVSSARPLRVPVVGMERAKRARVRVAERVKKTPAWIRTVASASAKTQGTASEIPRSFLVPAVIYPLAGPAGTTWLAVQTRSCSD
jgi:hypothetical protein